MNEYDSIQSMLSALIREFVRAIEAGEVSDNHDRAIRDAARIEAHFAGDDEVGWLVMGHKDDLKAAEIRDLSGMDQTQYETARRRFRRGLEKLFSGRSQK